MGRPSRPVSLFAEGTIQDEVRRGGGHPLSPTPLYCQRHDPCPLERAPWVRVAPGFPHAPILHNFPCSALKQVDDLRSRRMTCLVSLPSRFAPITRCIADFISVYAIKPKLSFTTLHLRALCGSVVPHPGKRVGRRVLSQIRLCAAQGWNCHIFILYIAPFS